MQHSLWRHILRPSLLVNTTSWRLMRRANNNNHAAHIHIHATTIQQQRHFNAINIQPQNQTHTTTDNNNISMWQPSYHDNRCMLQSSIHDTTSKLQVLKVHIILLLHPSNYDPYSCHRRNNHDPCPTIINQPWPIPYYNQSTMTHTPATPI